MGELRARGVALAVLSNKSGDLVRVIVEEVGLASFFDAVRGDEAGLARKPDPSVLLGLIDECGASVETSVMVGDGEADVLVGVNAKVRVVGVDWGVSSRGALMELGAAVVVKGFRDLLGVV